MFFGLSYGYLLLIVVTLAIGGLATWYVNSQLKKYTRVPISNGLTGAEAARRMLAYYGVTNVAVHRGGPGQDFFDPRTNSVTLSPDAFDGRSITATATACHEVGHACQYAENYAPMKIRGAIVPVVNLASNAWIFLLHAGHHTGADDAAHDARHRHVRRGGAVPAGHACRWSSTPRAAP